MVRRGPNYLQRQAAFFATFFLATFFTAFLATFFLATGTPSVEKVLAALYHDIDRRSTLRKRLFIQ